eukprot:scaffold1958_cov253-Pinguiococcus_pyrenoidosus.AAC.14
MHFGTPHRSPRLSRRRRKADPRSTRPGESAVWVRSPGLAAAWHRLVPPSNRWCLSSVFSRPTFSAPLLCCVLFALSQTRLGLCELLAASTHSAARKASPSAVLHGLGQRRRRPRDTTKAVNEQRRPPHCSLRIRRWSRCTAALKHCRLAVRPSWERHIWNGWREKGSADQ